ncbi:MAG: carA [Chlamydiales bacterium]|jgi:carbamoyl-phosphate synthase small subunit|nr:carA [Chlamydiales bacterium]
MKKEKAILVLQNGTVFHGISVGKEGIVCGEVVFNTSMTGYQEVLTDPSYAGQIIAFTSPHIGNVGINKEDMESSQPWLSGLIVREMSQIYSNWRGAQSLQDFLIQYGVVGITGIDTRKLTHILRDSGVQNGCIMNANIDEKIALDLARASPKIENGNWIQQVSTKQTYNWNMQDNFFSDYLKKKTKTNHQKHIIVYDCGVKYSILQFFASRNCKITVVPALTDVDEVLKLNPDGIVLSNGPGDPRFASELVTIVKKLLFTNLPILGVCLGCQLIGIALGCSIEKLKFGHHGTNHPVWDMVSKKVVISSQNHNYAVLESSLPENYSPTHRSAIDQTLQGFKSKDGKVIAFQGHPEGNSGPSDLDYIFDEFILKLSNRYVK